jgi:hypothetical protein
MRLDARLTASNGRIVAWVLVVDERTVAFDHRNGEAVSDRATRASVDDCGNVDKMWMRLAWEAAGKRILPSAIELSRRDQAQTDMS